ncbi:MAG: M15 family metallopeptidase [Candidatus Babeliales bacterium]
MRLWCIVSCFVMQIHALTDEMRTKGFVYLHEVDPSTQTSVRYATNENFVGNPVNGYNKPYVILTRQTAQALKKAQEALQLLGYELVVYDGGRPQRSVDHFVRWSEERTMPLTENKYLPRVPKNRVFELGYVDKKSGHSRGSTVDLTIIKKGAIVHEVQPIERQLTDGATITYLDDGTVDMGSSFDLFDEASHTESTLVLPEHQAMRSFLKKIMEQHGFKNYRYEWWHFTLVNEPFPADQESSYFDYVIE